MTTTTLCPNASTIKDWRECPICNPCIVVPGSDKVSLWDCDCPECRSLQRQADVVDVEPVCTYCGDTASSADPRTGKPLCWDCAHDGSN